MPDSMHLGCGSSGAGAVQVGPCGQISVSPLLILVALPRPERCRCCRVFIALELEVTEGQRVPAGQLSKPRDAFVQAPNQSQELLERPTPGIQGRDRLATAATGPLHPFQEPSRHRPWGREAVLGPRRWKATGLEQAADFADAGKLFSLGSKPSLPCWERELVLAELAGDLSSHSCGCSGHPVPTLPGRRA